MRDNKGIPDEFTDLHRRAEDVLQEQCIDVDELSPEDVSRVFHELQARKTELEMQNEELRQAQLELEAARDKYLDLYDLAPVAYFAINQDGLILEANLTGAALLDVERSCLIKKSLSHFVVSEDHDAFYAHHRRAFETHTRQTCELRMVKQDGSWFHAQLESLVVQGGTNNLNPYSGSATCCTIIRDITEQARALEALSRSEERYRLLFENSPVGLGLVATCDGRVLAANDAMLQLMGYSEVTTERINLESFYWNPQDRVLVLERLQRDGFVRDFGLELKRQDGTPIHASMTVNSLVLDGDENILLAVVQDITERVQAEFQRDAALEALQETNGRLDTLLEAIPDIIYFKDAQGRNLAVNKAYEKLLGLEREEIIGKTDEQLLPWVLAEQCQKSDRGTIQGRQLMRFEERLGGDEGKRIVFDTIKVPLLDDQGEVKGLVGISRDITERVQAEEALRESEERYRTTIDALDDTVHVVDRDLRMVLFNQACREAIAELGIERDPTGMEILEFCPFLPDGARAEYERVLETGKPLVTEEATTAGQHTVWTETRKIPILDEAGKTYRVVTIVCDITERVRALEALRESEERYRTTIDALGDAVHVVDRDQRLVLFNEALRERAAEFGGERDPTGLQVLDLFPFLPDKVHKEYERVFKTGEPLVTEEEIRVGQRTVWAETRKIPILDEAGRTQRVVTIMRDITERVQANDMLGIYASQQAAMVQLSASLAALLDETDVCRAVVRELHDTLGYEHLGVFLVDESTGDRVLCANIGWPDPSSFLRISPGHGLSERPLLDGQLHYTPDVTRDPRYIPGLNSGAEVDVPLRVGDEMLGVLAVESSQPDAFDEGDFTVLTAAANQASVAIERAREHQAVQQAQARYRSLFDGVPVGLFRGTPAGQILDANLTLVRMLGYPDRDSLLAINAVDTYMSPQELDHLRDRAEREEGLRNWQQRMSRLDGTSIWVEMNARIVRDDDGQVLHYEGTLEDITERVQAEQALRESEERFRSLIEHSPVGISISRDGLTQYGNSAYLRMFGYDDIAEVRGTSLGHRIAPQRREEVVNRSRQRERGATEPSSFDSIGQRRDGSLFPLHIQVARIELSDGPATIAFLTDITERVQAEEALRESEEKYRLLVENASEAIVVTGCDGRFLVANDAAAQTLFLKPQELIGKTLWDVLPEKVADQRMDDLNMVIQSGQGHVLETSNPVQGEMRWFRSSIQPLRDSAGEITRILSLSTDITERVRAEQALQRRNLELLLLNQASQAFSSSLDLDQVLATVLEEVCRLLDVTSGSVWLVDPQTDELVCQQDAGPHSEIVRGWRLAPGQGVAGWMVQTGESVIVPDTRADDRYFKKLDRLTGLELRSLLGVPLRVKEEVIGVLHVTDTEPNRFKLTDLALVEPLAATAAIAIENAQLYEQARQDAETRSVLLHEVNHRVKNNLASIMGVLSLEMERTFHNAADFQSVMYDLQSRVRGLATVHDMLSATEWSPLSLYNLVTKVIHAALSGSPLRHKIQVKVTPPAERLLVAPKQATALAVIVNELTTNSIKYAFRDRDEGCIDVQIATEGKDKQQVTLKFRNDGPGWPDDVLQRRRKSVGLRLVRMNVRSPLRGKVLFHNDGGAATTVTFTLPPLD